MRRFALSMGLLLAMALALAPPSAFAQAGVTPLAVDPYPLASGTNEWRGYLTIEDEIDLFGVYRRGISGGMDFGLRLGYSDVFDGGIHFGGDLRYGLPVEGSELGFALAAGLQASIADLGNIIAVPFGVSIGADVGSGERTVIVYGLPHLLVERIDPDGPGDDTELEFGVELGGEIELSPQLWLHSALTIATNDNDNVELALGLIWHR